ncbi:MAG: hypothetical protein HC825_07295 [Oscillatoriales cyanobacterium RM1_1_9]|nr:hypothetical protein [Oscillatoriales cyanobacterium RM1_1_9]
MWQQFRTPFLAGISSSVFLVLGQVLIAPLPEKTSAEVVINLPPEVPLVGWQTVSERSAAESSSGNTTLPPSDRDTTMFRTVFPWRLRCVT